MLSVTSARFSFAFHSMQSAALASGALTIVQNIVVNPGLAKAMHAQSGAEREKRARIIVSEGERTSTQNYSEGNTAMNTHSVCNSFPLLPGKRQSDINQSEGARQQAINIAEGLYVASCSFFILIHLVYTAAHFFYNCFQVSTINHRSPSSSTNIAASVSTLNTLTKYPRLCPLQSWPRLTGVRSQC